MIFVCLSLLQSALYITILSQSSTRTPDNNYRSYNPKIPPHPPSSFLHSSLRFYDAERVWRLGAALFTLSMAEKTWPSPAQVKKTPPHFLSILGSFRSGRKVLFFGLWVFEMLRGKVHILGCYATEFSLLWLWRWWWWLWFKKSSALLTFIICRDSVSVDSDRVSRWKCRILHYSCKRSKKMCQRCPEEG